VKISEWCLFVSRVPITERLEKVEAGEEPLNKEDHELYRSLVGSALYLVVGTRPDLAYVCSVLGKFVSKPTERCLRAAMQMIAYVKGTVDVGLWYPHQESFELTGYSDTDHCSEQDRLSRYANIFEVGLSLEVIFCLQQSYKLNYFCGDL
jgi:hypothetical protein